MQTQLKFTQLDRHFKCLFLDCFLEIILLKCVLDGCFTNTFSALKKVVCHFFSNLHRGFSPKDRFYNVLNVFQANNSKECLMPAFFIC